MDRKLYYIDKNKIKQKSNKNKNETENNNSINKNDINNSKEDSDTNYEDVLDKMKNNINNLKLHKPLKEKSNIKNTNDININNNIIKNDNIIINSINIENNIINNNANILYFNNKNDLSKKDLANLIMEQKAKNNNNINNINIEKDTNISNKNNENIIDENLNINENINLNQDYKNINFQNKAANKNNINILQNLKGIPNPNIGYGSTLMSNVSYSSFLSFKNKKVKFVNLNASINQSLINNKSRQEEIKKLEEEDEEKINQKEQEKMMKNILDRLGGNNDIIKENEHENEIGIEDSENNIKIEENKNLYKNKNISNNNKNLETEENESLLFNLSKQYEIIKNQKSNEKNNKDEKEDSTEEQKIKINSIKCTLSFLDKGKAIFVSENDDIFWLPSATLNENIKVGNSYLFQIDKLNNQIKKLNEIEFIQNKYREWK